MQWDKALECGVEPVDSEHRQLFQMVEDLLNSAKIEHDLDAPSKALAFLEDYVVTHFAHEEALMQRCAYPHAGEHAELHAKFTQALKDLKTKYELSNGSRNTIKEINHTAMSWLVNHIQVIDMRFTKYYLEHASQTQPNG